MTNGREKNEGEDIFRDLPTLEIERLTLRKFTFDDAQDMFEYSSEPDLTRLYLGKLIKALMIQINF